MEEIFSLGNEKWLSKERNGKKGEINVLFSLLYRQTVRQAGWPEIALQIETQLGQRLYQFSYDFLPTALLRGMQDFGIRKVWCDCCFVTSVLFVLPRPCVPIHKTYDTASCPVFETAADMKWDQNQIWPEYIWSDFICSFWSYFPTLREKILQKFFSFNLL